MIYVCIANKTFKILNYSMWSLDIDFHVYIAYVPFLHAAPRFAESHRRNSFCALIAKFLNRLLTDSFQYRNSSSAVIFARRNSTIPTNLDRL